MRYREDFPEGIREIEHLWIPMPDQVRLGARLWLPETAERQPVPAILEYIPYRKRDLTAERDEVMHPYFAGHGYASIRVDLRGSGDSEGVLRDEYLEQELEDGLAVIRWLAEQPWCNGRVGIIGKSWGGFNGLQLAWLQPEALGAVVTVCSTDDRYADDVHYMGGCLLGDNLSWASTMFAFNSTPPDPALVGENWRDMWHRRLEGSGLWLDKWLRHQVRDEYWRHGSICQDYDRIRCPVMAVSGWADGYCNAVFRMLANLRVPRLGLIGPWSHKYPHEGVPGPAIGFLQECVRWWDHWLKDQETGIMQEPMLRAWMQDSMPPHTSYTKRHGRWVGEAAWPSQNIRPLRYRLAQKLLVPEDQAGEPGKRFAGQLFIQSPLSTGLFAGKWCSYSATPDLPHDQREEDGGALVFDSPALEETIEILGSAEVELTFSSDKPVAMLCARLSDIRPDNKATRVTYGLLNLCHRDSHETPRYLEPGKKYTVTIKLNDIAQQFPAGHWLRIALSSSYWPLAWPAPESARLTIYPDESELRLPRRQPREDDASIDFAPAEGARPTEFRQLQPGNSNWIVNRDLAANRSTLNVIKDDGWWHQENIDMNLHSKTLEWYSFVGDDYDSLQGDTYWKLVFQRDDWQVKTVTRTRLTSDRYNFILRAELDAYEGEVRVKSLNWDCRIPRDHV